jgi:hypothetical protein
MVTESLQINSCNKSLILTSNMKFPLWLLRKPLKTHSKTFLKVTVSVLQQRLSAM